MQLPAGPLLARHPAERYADDVLSGKIPACSWVRLCVQRHRRDLETGHLRGLFFMPEAGQAVIDFFLQCRHSKGEWAGQVIELMPHQQFIVWVLFGWMRANGSRRFRHAYVEMARKGGKSTLLAGLGLYCLDGDGEEGAEVYTAATKKDQAGIIHGESKRMVRKSPALRRRIKEKGIRLVVAATESWYEPLGADSTTLDGLNTSAALCDELHRWKLGDLLDVIEGSTGARQQPMIIRITTAGQDLESVCGSDKEHTERVLEGAVQDDAWFGIVYTIDKGDDPFDEAVWVKANPGLPVAPKLDDLREMAERAQTQPSKLGGFLRQRLDVWSTAGERLIDSEKWRLCSDPVDVEALAGRPCFGGLDLASVSDLVAWVLFFPPWDADEMARILVRQYVPRECLLDAGRAARVSYEAWVRDGFLTATPGDVTDIDWVLEDVRRDAKAFALQGTAFDRYGALMVLKRLQEIGSEMGFNGEEWAIEWGQGHVSQDAPMKELLRLYLSRRLAHGGHPVLAWEAGNLVARINEHGQMAPSKRLSRQKIDGMVSLIMAIGMWLRSGPVCQPGFDWG